MQIFKNSEAQEVIISSVQIELHGSVSRLKTIWLNLASWLAIFAMQYLLKLWELDGVCNPDCISRFMEHLGAFLVKV
jgi:hypothetical protein